MKPWLTRIAAISISLLPLLASAATPIATVPKVDLPRYMGDWYVIASIPTRFERHGWNAVESYRLASDGSIDTRFRLNVDGYNGSVRHLHSTGYVQAGSGNAEWSVHFFWLLRLQYKIAWLAPDYSEVIVARDARDYVWLMARTPTIPDADYVAMLERVKAMGYDTSQVQRVPQRWPDAQGCARVCDNH